MSEIHPSMRNVLLVEDDSSLRLTQSLYLQSEGFQVGSVAGFAEAHQELLRKAYDVVVTDLRLGEDSGLDVLQDVRKLHPGTEVLMITGYGSVDTAVAAMKEGAYDYLTKPVDPEHLVHTIRKAIERKHLRRQVSYLQRKVVQDAGLDHIVAVSRPMREIIETVKRIASSDATVLIEGESGTGKELMAKLIHQYSKRSTEPFLTINCGAMPENLLENELFGHLRGAFTGAHKDQKGLFEAANGGTLFLDEIAETSFNFQVKLLRAIQEKRIRRVGDTGEIIVDVRVLAASNQDLARLVRDGRFRQDLFFRLKVIPIHLPPLRERREDILPLAENYLSRQSNRMGRRPPRLTQKAEEKLGHYDWPGNVRELENTLERALIFNKGGEIDAPDLMLETAFCRELFSESAQNYPLISLEELERRHILEVLNRCENKTRAAQILGIGYNTLWRKLKKYCPNCD